MKRAPPKKQNIEEVVDLRTRSKDPRLDPQATQKISRDELDAVLRRSSGVRARVEDPRRAPPPANEASDASLEIPGPRESSADPQEATVRPESTAIVTSETTEALRTPTPLDPRIVVTTASRARRERVIVMSVTLALVLLAVIGLIGFFLGRAMR
ncbi:MAG: hypothetical protein KF819_33000 [Labilithrix sp.]|nr:hypothetical protein [Labilithrix sp.]